MKVCECVDKKLTVYKANKVVEAGYRLTLNEQRVVLACISMINSNKPLTASDKFELSAKEFAVIFNISEDTAYNQLVEVAKTLYERSVVIEASDKDSERIVTRWISGVRYQKSSGKMTLYFAQLMIPYLSEIKNQFTRYDLKNISGMSSIYGIRLYELLMQWRSSGYRDVSIQWLKSQFELDDEYERIFDLKKRVIEPAVKDINTHSNLTVVHSYKKTGRNVTHVVFEFNEKQPTKQSSTKLKPAAVITPQTSDNNHGALIEEFANSRKRFGDAAVIPEEFVSILKQQGRC
jgi:plasmid replication initiation protein